MKFPIVITTRRYIKQLEEDLADAEYAAKQLKQNLAASARLNQQIARGYVKALAALRRVTNLGTPNMANIGKRMVREANATLSELESE